jgi:hypothetical protein
MIINEHMLQDLTAHNRTVYASGAKAPSGYVLARSFASLIPTQKTPPHFASPGLCCAKPLSGLAKRRKQPERYVKFASEFS